MASFFVKHSYKFQSDEEKAKIVKKNVRIVINVKNKYATFHVTSCPAIIVTLSENSSDDDGDEYYAEYCDIGVFCWFYKKNNSIDCSRTWCQGQMPIFDKCTDLDIEVTYENL